MTADAVLAYHTALEFRGKAYSVYTRLYYVSTSKSLPLTFQAHEFVRAPVPHPLRAKGKEMFGVTTHKRSGVELRVTNLERTFVDVLDRPDLTGSWEEIWRSLQSVEFFDLDQVIEYVFLLENATTAASGSSHSSNGKPSTFENTKGWPNRFSPLFLPTISYPCPPFNSLATSRKLARAAAMFSTISSTSTSGSGRLSRSVRLASFSHKISRLALSREIISS